MQCLWKGWGEGRVKGIKHSPVGPLDRTAQTGLLQPLGNHLLPVTTEDLHTDLALHKGSLTLAAPLEAAHKPARFKTGLEGTSMKNKPQKTPQDIICTNQRVLGLSSPRPSQAQECNGDPLSTSTNKVTKLRQRTTPTQQLHL